jgi:hypothetical protein
MFVEGTILRQIKGEPQMTNLIILFFQILFVGFLAGFLIEDSWVVILTAQVGWGILDYFGDKLMDRLATRIAARRHAEWCKIAGLDQ